MDEEKRLGEHLEMHGHDHENEDRHEDGLEFQKIESREREPERHVELEREGKRNSWIVPVLALLALAVAGLGLFSSTMTRRNGSPNTPTRITRRVIPEQSPTKRVPGISETDIKDLNTSISKAREATRDGDWATARRETTRLGSLWARFKPRATGMRPAIDTASFDAIYARLKANVNLRDKDMTLRDLTRLDRLIKDLNNRSRSQNSTPNRIQNRMLP
ncbi:MAG TPA: hypothetical protein DDX03_10275 [Firmicutes bacterium]|jgi:hypothetical protein|nr:hypothetical protein [Bacillota bacterium]